MKRKIKEKRACERFAINGLVKCAYTNSDDVFEEEIRKQVLLAIDEADVVLFLVDVISGITDLDQTIAGMLRRIDKPVILVVNKVDNANRLYDASVFYGLGLGDYFALSSINGSGTGELLDKVTSVFQKLPEVEEEEEVPRIAVVGRPNVGKSSRVSLIQRVEILFDFLLMNNLLSYCIY